VPSLVILVQPFCFHRADRQTDRHTDRITDAAKCLSHATVIGVSNDMDMVFT